MSTENEHSTDTKTRLMDTAVELIRQSNYDNVGVAEICKHAGVTKGSFYHYFESKAELFYESAHHHWASIKPMLDAAFSPENSGLEQLEQLISLVLHKQLEHEYSECTPVLGCPFFVAGGQVGAEDVKVRQAAQELSFKAIAYNKSLVQTLQSEGLVPLTLPADDLARILYEYIMGLMIYGRVTEDAECIRKDLRIGLCQLLHIAPEHWPSA